MSLLSLCQEAARLVGEPRPSHVINNKEVGVARLLAFARLEGVRLARAFPWQALVKEATLLTLDQEDQGPITIVAPDFDRLVAGGLYNRTRGHRIFGPIEEGRWQRLKASGATTGGGGFRLRGGRLLMLPAPPTGETLAFEYVSTRWIDSDGDGAGDATEFIADTDRILLDNDLVLLGMV